MGQVRALLLELAPSLSSTTLQLVTTTAWLPSGDGAPLARRNVLHHSVVNGADSGELTAVAPAAPALAQWQLTGIQVDPLTALTALTHLDHQSSGRTVQAPGSWRRLRLGNDLLFWSNAAKVALEILVGQHYLPGLQADGMGGFHGAWQMALFEPRIERQVTQLLRAMPPVCRAYDLADWRDAPSAEALGEHVLSTLVDVAARHWGRAELPDRADSPASLWMLNLLTEHRHLMLGPQAAHEFYADWRNWTDQLRVPADANFRICFVLYEPETGAIGDDTTAQNGARSVDFWRLRYYLQARDNPALLVPAREVWETQENSLRVGERRLDRPQERLLAGLGIASRLFAPIERSLRSPQPEEALLTTEDAYSFMREIGPLLESSGFGLILPDWWRNNERARLGLRLRMQGADPSGDDLWGDEDDDAAGRAIRYRWLLTLGGEPLSRAEFDELVAKQTPLVNLRGRWIELDPAQVDAAKEFLNRRQTDGSMSFLRSLRMAQTFHKHAQAAGDDGQAGLLDDAETRQTLDILKDVPAQLPLEEVDVEGWLEVTLARLRQQDQPQQIAEPGGFVGSLRPYQQRGVGWLAYLRKLDMGACLADDMGLGKTIQAIALLLHVREEAAKHHVNGNGAGNGTGGGNGSGDATRVPPALLICPTSVVANWKHEIDRFAPSLRALTHHGVSRLSGDAFCKALARYDLIITSYGTARRDVDMLAQVEWSDLILDEAQNIKNPRAKQTQAVRSLQAGNRIALTGTPVENQLAELWSIIEYLNPGYLGGFEHFRKEYVIPIERYNDDERAAELRRLVQPFLLRRLKSDPTIISDLPEKNEMVVYCGLTKEQAELYETTVQTTLDKLDRSDGIRRRSRAGAGHQAEADHQSSGPLPARRGAVVPAQRQARPPDGDVGRGAERGRPRPGLHPVCGDGPSVAAPSAPRVADRRALPPRRHHGQAA
ncbi:MAG: DEAD/DEAH box helicase [Caldilineaceae bacterium]